MGFKRKSSRVEIGKPGRLHRGSLSAPCQVINVSENGMRIQSRLFVRHGDALKLSMELDQGLLNCDIEVINPRPPHFGATIVSITPENRERLLRIVDDEVQRSFLGR